MTKDILFIIQYITPELTEPKYIAFNEKTQSISGVLTEEEATIFIAKAKSAVKYWLLEIASHYPTYTMYATNPYTKEQLTMPRVKPEQGPIHVLRRAQKLPPLSQQDMEDIKREEFIRKYFKNKLKGACHG